MTEGWAILKDSSPKSPASLRHRPYNLGRAPIGTQVDDGVTTQTSLQVCSNAVLLKRASTVQPPPASCSIMQSYDELLGLLGQLAVRHIKQRHHPPPSPASAIPTSAGRHEHVSTSNPG